MISFDFVLVLFYLGVKIYQVKHNYCMDSPFLSELSGSSQDLGKFMRDSMNFGSARGNDV